jgi:hypothetical protein
MSKKDISKILKQGTAKQRALLLAEDIARAKHNKDKILTDHEFNEITDSFNKPNEIKIYNKFRRADRVVTNALLNLQGLKFETLMNFANLRGYLILWYSIENTEQIVNIILHEVKDKKERKRIAEKGAKGGQLLLSRNTVDEEAYLEIDINFDTLLMSDENGKIDLKSKRTTKENSLLFLMNNVKMDAINSATRFISWSQALEDFMEEEGFNVKTYKDLLNSMRGDLNRPLFTQKYRQEKDTFIGFPKRADRLKSKYSIAPNIEAIEVNKDIYNQFKRDFLGGEDE